jgi:hypothetical protein
MAGQTQGYARAASFALSAGSLIPTTSLVHVAVSAVTRWKRSGAFVTTNRRNDMTTTELTLTVRVTNTTLDEMHEHVKYIADELTAMFEDNLEQCATITDITISDDSKPRTFVSKLAE